MRSGYLHSAIRRTEIIHEIGDAFTGTGVSPGQLPDIAGAFDAQDTGHFLDVVKTHQHAFVTLLEEKDVTLRVLRDFSEREALMDTHWTRQEEWTLPAHSALRSRESYRMKEWLTMQRYLTLLIFIALIILVVTRVILLKRSGIKAMKFGALDRKDFLLPPFFLFYLYLLIAGVFDLPRTGFELIHHDGTAWIGVGIALLGLLLFLMSVVALGRSFRVGIDEDAPGKLVTTGVYAYTRNPIYLAFGLVSLGVFLVISNWIFLLYLLCGSMIVNRQVLREEEALKKVYGAEYLEYFRSVPRYL